MILGTVNASGHRALFLMGLAGAFMTAFYMMRACALTFMGDARERDRFAHAHRTGAARDVQPLHRHGNHDRHEHQRREHFRQREAGLPALLACGDLLPLSAGDLSPSNASTR